MLAVIRGVFVRVAAGAARDDFFADVRGRPLAHLLEGVAAHFHVLACQADVAVKLGDQGAAAGVV